MTNMGAMFACSPFNQPIGNWDVSNVEDMSGMFYEAKFNSDISKWKINPECNVDDMFDKCKIPEKYKPKL